MKGPRPEPTFFEKATIWIGSPASVIAHTAFFIFAFLMGSLGFAEWNTVLLVLTTIVSLEAIYLAIFIQMSVNRQAKELEEVSEDIDEIQEDVDEIQEDIDEIQSDVDEIQEDVEEIGEDVEDIQEDVEELSEEEQAVADAEAAVKVIQTGPGMDHVLMEVRKILKELEDLKAQLPKKAVETEIEEKKTTVKTKAVPVMKKIAQSLAPRKRKNVE